MENKFYVYIYLDPRKPGIYDYGELILNHEPFYVGYGHGNRKNFHLYESKTTKNSLKLNKIRKLNSLNLKPIILTYKDNLLEPEAKELEIKTIMTIGRIDLKTGPLSNLTNGGDGTSGMIFSEDLKRMFSERMKGELNHMFNKKHSPETIKKISKTKNDKLKSGEIIPKKHSDEWRMHLKNNNPSQKQVNDSLIIELNKKGKTNKEINKITGITIRIIENRLLKYGLKRNQNKNDKILIDINYVHQLKLQGFFYKDIAKMLNVSESVISRNYRNSKYYNT